MCLRCRLTFSHSEPLGDDSKILLLAACPVQRKTEGSLQQERGSAEMSVVHVARGDPARSVLFGTLVCLENVVISVRR